MKDIKNILDYNKLKNFGTLSHDEFRCNLYKAIYNDYPIDYTRVYHFTTPESGLSFNLVAMWFGKLPFLGRHIDGSVDEFFKTEVLSNEIPTKNNSPILRAGTDGLVSGYGRGIVKLNSVDSLSRTYNNSNTKYSVSFKCKDLTRFFNDLKPVMIFDEHYFINYDNETLYNFYITWHNYEIKYNFIMMYGPNTDIGKELEFFAEYFETMKTEEREPNTFNYLYKTQQGLTCETLEMDFYDITDEFIKKNYNDDLPYNKIEKFINGDDSGICLLHGEPGTGKSTFIKHLIGKHTGCNFIYIPSSLMMQLDENELANYILRTAAKSIYIIEDCEALITDRNKHYNAILPTLLNFSDGIVGGSLKPKFILTFNCPISQIDKAVLRKGRLKIKYDFKPLCLDKAKRLYPDATCAMPLCELYNREDNGTEDNGKKRIGFWTD